MGFPLFSMIHRGFRKFMKGLAVFGEKGRIFECANKSLAHGAHMFFRRPRRHDEREYIPHERQPPHSISIELACAAVLDEADLGDPAVLDGHVGPSAREAGAVDDDSVADHQIVGGHWAPD